MKRMHIGLDVEDLDESVAFYTRLFGRPPALQRDGYAKWMLDDPLLNFAINTTDRNTRGVSHLGIQVESNDELDEVRATWDERGFDRADQDDLVCGYQRQDKSWVHDPQQMPWEVFVTHGVEDDYGTNEMPDPT
ncbi:MAG: ArsI/CadI family heavy metal resistance metalloenzyme [Ilumatobacter sp.]|uniref:ArsI/CadI family heavy metal resistance metalloenzyme n=1 Tax=Ilumatobacter sp. TaxID=1967498 RepID=UPI0026323414|nr:ArsI/CadI family heavy metal resistance metalloenzyme [Ilumatobacter sp.]MDJ0771665.1 ArsI/CadI family heavy metal resistance metalloenzyme [Ilumatobacter sp.]